MALRIALITTTACAIATLATAADKRELHAHEHGVGTLNIAVEGNIVLMELQAPGFDIVGFEHEAESSEDKAKIKAALAVLGEPSDLIQVSSAAGCAVTDVHTELLGDDHHDHGSDDADHDDHSAEGEAHHDHDDDHADHGHGDESEAANHTEFHAEYVLSCADATAIAEIAFPYFSVFPNSEELEIQMISAKGTAGFEVRRDQPILPLDGAI